MVLPTSPSGPCRSPGIEICSIKQIVCAVALQIEAPSTTSICFTRTWSDKVNDGWRGAITTLMNERASIGFGDRPGLRLPGTCCAWRRRLDWNGRPGAAGSVGAPAPRGVLREERRSSSTPAAIRNDPLRLAWLDARPRVPIGKLVGALLRQHQRAILRPRAPGRGRRHPRPRAPGDATSSAELARRTRVSGSRVARTRSCTTSSRSACSVCPAKSASTRTRRSRTSRPARFGRPSRSQRWSAATSACARATRSRT